MRGDKNDASSLQKTQTTTKNARKKRNQPIQRPHTKQKRKKTKWNNVSCRNRYGTQLHKYAKYLHINILRANEKRRKCFKFCIKIKISEEKKQPSDMSVGDSICCVCFFSLSRMCSKQMCAAFVCVFRECVKLHSGTDCASTATAHQQMATATTVNHAHIDASAYVLTCLQHFFGVLLFCYSSFDCGLHSLRLSDIEKNNT